MIGDEQRGFAWTRALLGLPANEIHVCGDLSAVALVKQIAAECGDEFELRVGGLGVGCVGALMRVGRAVVAVKEGTFTHVCMHTRALAHTQTLTHTRTHIHARTQTYARMTPLAVDEGCLRNGWADVKPGDCIVAFNRAQLYHIKKVGRGTFKEQRALLGEPVVVASTLGSHALASEALPVAHHTPQFPFHVAPQSVEAESGQKVCLVYGALPAETRRAQARLFNDPEGDHKVRGGRADTEGCVKAVRVHMSWLGL